MAQMISHVLNLGFTRIVDLEIIQLFKIIFVEGITKLNRDQDADLHERFLILQQ
jgi:hypothetical protein